MSPGAQRTEALRKAVLSLYNRGQSGVNLFGQAPEAATLLDRRCSISPRELMTFVEPKGGSYGKAS